MHYLQKGSLDASEPKPARVPDHVFQDQDHQQTLRIVNHELKAGLRALAELPVWIEEDMRGHQITLPSDVQGHLDLMRHSANHMTVLLDGLIGFSSAGPTFDEPVRLTVEQVARRAWEECEASQSFNLQTHDALDTLYLPRKALRSIFKAVLENALHHHDQARGQVTVASESDGDRVWITIEDDGPGIPAQSRADVFDCLVTLRRREETGRAGLGLTLAKTLITRLGGTITLTSASNGRGTAVLINLPMRARF